MDTLEQAIIILALELDSSVINYKINIDGSIKVTKNIRGQKVTYTMKKK